MPYRDLREFLKRLEEIGQLRKVEGAEWNLEIGALSHLVSEKRGPALLFDRIKGYPAGFRVATNIFHTVGRVALALDMPPDSHGLDIINMWRKRHKEVELIPPVEVQAGPVLENVLTGNDVDLFRFPVPKWLEGDGGRFIGTGSCVVMRDPDEGWVNAGTYRVQIHDKAKATVMISAGHHGALIREKYWAKGMNCPVAICCGQEPVLWIASAHALPWGVSEYDYAGWIRGKPVEVVKGPTTGLPIPATAEIVIEGEIVPRDVESLAEGPFGEWPGYYASGTRPEPVIRVTAILHRNDPIIQGAPRLRPPNLNFPVPLMQAPAIWDSLEREGIPDIRGVWQLEAGGASFITVISLKQRYAGHAKRAAMAASGSYGGGESRRLIIVVDEDVDPTDVNDVLWAVATRCDPESDIDIVRGCLSSPIDPRILPEKRAREDYTTSRAIILACKPFAWMGQFPKTCSVSPEMKAVVNAKWPGIVD